MTVSRPQSLFTPMPPEMRNQYLADVTKYAKNREMIVKTARYGLYILSLLTSIGMCVGLLCCSGAIQSIELNVSAWIFTAISLASLLYLEKRYLQVV